MVDLYTGTGIPLRIHVTLLLRVNVLDLLNSNGFFLVYFQLKFD